MATKLYQVRWPMEYAGKPRDYGQVIELVGALNDAKLLRLGYLIECKLKPRELVECPECGGKFIGHTEKIEHVRKRHREMTEEQEEDLAEREESRLMQIAPLNLENTIASRQ